MADKGTSPAKRKEFLFSAALVFLFWTVISFPADTHSPLWLNNLIQHLVVGLILSVIVTRLTKKPLFTAEEISRFSLPRLLYFSVYVAYLVGQIVVAGIDVARRVLRKKLLIQPYLVEFHTPLKEEIPLLVNGNSITLTPGTITVEVEQEAGGSRFLVHCISEEAAQHIRQSGGFVKKILRFYGREQNGG